MIFLTPLNPTMHADYVAALDDPGRLPGYVRARALDLLARRNVVSEDEVDAVDRELVDLLYWYVVRPDDVARRVLDLHGWSRRHPLTVEQATTVLAAIGEAGYPIAGNGAPEYPDPIQRPPVRGLERDCVVWAAARYWAEAAARRLMYVSLGDCRGFLPRAVQYDQPGSVHPMQRAALTFGPARGDSGSHDYVRRHCRLLLRVAPDGDD